MILTAMTQDAMADRTRHDATIARTPLRALGTPGDIAYAVLYLASDLSTFVTGTDILVDGGLASTITI
jgi:NAD(P)-dependent dehydrogenase (short-subunit alcohol dehydrogenase family)